jgi:phage terminase large subunit-like protein
LELLRSGSLTEEEAAVAEYEWRVFFARDNQLAPEGDWRICLWLAGRGFGKTRTLAEWVREEAEAGHGPGAIVGRSMDDVRDVLIEGPAGIIAMSPPWFRPVYEPSKKHRLTWPNGVTARGFSAEEPDQLRGPQHAWAACDELAAWSYLEEAMSNLEFGLRLGKARMGVATSPRPLPQLREWVSEADREERARVNQRSIYVFRGRTRDNFENLSPKAVQSMEKRYAGTRLGRQELDGEILDDIPGALWTRAMLQEAVERGKPWSFVTERGKSRELADHNLFDRIVVAVDPSGSDGSERGDFIGIMVAGKLKGVDHAVVLRDRTCQKRPEEWAKDVAAEYEHWQADAVVAEANFGGDMVRALLQNAMGGMRVKMVSASRGKHVRAEPVSGLYEQGRVHHAKPFPLLDDELCFFTPNGYQDKVSPNRADALVWAITDLLLEPAAAPRIRRV